MVSFEQKTLADLMEKGLAYKPTGESDKVTETHHWWFNNLAEDELLRGSGAKGYHCNAMGFALIGKLGSPDLVWKEMKASWVWRANAREFIRRTLFISRDLFNAADDLHDHTTSVRQVIEILRTRDLYPELVSRQEPLH